MYQGEKISYSKDIQIKKIQPHYPKHKIETKTQLKIFSFLFLPFPSNSSANKQTQMWKNIIIKNQHNLSIHQTVTFDEDCKSFPRVANLEIKNGGGHIHHNMLNKFPGDPPYNISQ